MCQISCQRRKRDIIQSNIYRQNIAKSLSGHLNLRHKLYASYYTPISSVIQIYIASKVNHHYNNYYIRVYYKWYSPDDHLFCNVSLSACLLEPQYQIRMPFDDTVQDLRCPVYTKPHLRVYPKKAI